MQGGQDTLGPVLTAVEGTPALLVLLMKELALDVGINSFRVETGVEASWIPALCATSENPPALDGASRPGRGWLRTAEKLNARCTGILPRRKFS